MLTRNEALRSTRANALKQLPFFNAEHLKCLSPKMLNVIRKTLFTNLSFPEQVEKKCQDNADDNAGSDGKIKSEIVLLDQDVTRQLPKPRHPGCQDE
jgi:hypothetical protein